MTLSIIEKFEIARTKVFELRELYKELDDQLKETIKKLVEEQIE